MLRGGDRRLIRFRHIRRTAVPCTQAHRITHLGTSDVRVEIWIRSADAATFGGTGNLKGARISKGCT